MSNKKAQQVLNELFIRCRKLNISLCFLTKSYFSVPKELRLNCTHYVIFKLNNKRELQDIAINRSADIDYKDLYRNCTKELYNFLTIDTILPINDRLSSVSFFSFFCLSSFFFIFFRFSSFFHFFANFCHFFHFYWYKMHNIRSLTIFILTL